MVLLGPGSTVSHDALRLLAQHGTALSAVGEDGVRLYTAQPLLPDFSALARAQTRAWADAKGARIAVPRAGCMRGGSGRRCRTTGSAGGDAAGGVGHAGSGHRGSARHRGRPGQGMYRLTAQRMGVRWQARRYDRHDPMAADLPNQAINQAASAVEAAAAIAVAATATIPQLGFIHEEAGHSFVLDIADLYRDSVTVPCAFKAAALMQKRGGDWIERITRRVVGERLRRDKVIGHDRSD